MQVSTDSADMAISYASFSHDRYTTAGDVSAQYDTYNVFLVTRKPQAMPAAW